MRLLGFLGSPKLALVVVALLFLFTLAGVLVPQEGRVDRPGIALWQDHHPAVTSLCAPLGLFRAFHSWPFMATLFLLGLNTLTCTALHLVALRHAPPVEGAPWRTTGFLLLHLSLLIIMGGGLASSAGRLSARIVLTEGEVFDKRHGTYARLVAGPLSRREGSVPLIQLDDVVTTFGVDGFPLDVRSHVAIPDATGVTNRFEIRVNHPISTHGFTIMQDENGFAPRLTIHDVASSNRLLSSFIALKTFKEGRTRTYHDFLPLHFLEQRIDLTFFPWGEASGPAADGDGAFDQAALLFEVKDKDGQTIAHQRVARGEPFIVGRYRLAFTDVREWASLAVSVDPGYGVVCTGLWLGVVSLLMRYAPMLGAWFRSNGESRAEGQGRKT
jgi:cytochrome c biogenesis protein ResB